MKIVSNLLENDVMLILLWHRHVYSTFPTLQSSASCERQTVFSCSLIIPTKHLSSYKYFADSVNHLLIKKTFVLVPNVVTFQYRRLKSTVRTWAKLFCFFINRDRSKEINIKQMVVQGHGHIECIELFFVVVFFILQITKRSRYFLA